MGGGRRGSKKKIISGKRILRESRNEENIICESPKATEKLDDEVYQAAGKENAIYELPDLDQLLVNDVKGSPQGNDDLSEKTTQTESQINPESATTKASHIPSSVDNLHADLELAARVKDDFKEIMEKEFTEQLAKKDAEYKVAVFKASKELQEAEERYKKVISEKEECCRAVVFDKENLEGNVLKLNKENQAISAEFEAASMAWDMEKADLLSQTVAARNKSEEMSIQNERVLLQYRAEKVVLESGLSESKARCKELLQKIVEDRKLWDSEKANLENNVAELQTRLSSMSTERELLNHQNRELSSEVESLKAHLDESNSTTAKLEDQLSSLETAKMLLEEENKSLKTQMNIRTFVSEEKQVNMERKERELKTILDSIKKDLDSSRATTMEKERNIVDLQHNLSVITERKKCLEERNRSLMKDINKSTLVLEENARLRVKVRKLENTLLSLDMDGESKDVRLSRCVQRSRNGLCDEKKTKVVFEKERPKWPLPPGNEKENDVQLRENRQGNGLSEKTKPNVVFGKERPLRVLQKRTSQKLVVEMQPMPVKGTPQKPLPERPKPMWL